MIDKIHIKPTASSELISKVTANDVTYIINTEKEENSSLQSLSRVYLGGKIIYSKVSDFSHLTVSNNFRVEIENFIVQAHKTVVAQFITQLKKCQKNKTEYLRDARYLINTGKDKEALGLLKDGVEVFPDEPLMHSYYGSIYSKAGKKPVEGIKICRDAIQKFNSQIRSKNEFLKPIFYLNLGKAYLGANKKKEAINAFNIGLKEDPTNANIISEICKLGRRKEPIIPFLERGNSLNKYLGLFLNRTGLSRR